jgi:hypothetical protein
LNSCCLLLKGKESREPSHLGSLWFFLPKQESKMVSCQSFEVIVLGWPENGLQITLKVTNFLNFQVHHVMRCKIIFSLGCLTSKFIWDLVRYLLVRWCQLLI